MESLHHHSTCTQLSIALNLYCVQVRRRAKDGRLKPLTMSARLSLLRAHGVHQVDREESAAIETVQVSGHLDIVLARIRSAA